MAVGRSLGLTELRHLHANAVSKAIKVPEVQDSDSDTDSATVSLSDTDTSAASWPDLFPAFCGCLTSRQLPRRWLQIQIQKYEARFE